MVHDFRGIFKATSMARSILTLFLTLLFHWPAFAQLDENEINQGIAESTEAFLQSKMEAHSDTCHAYQKQLTSIYRNISPIANEPNIRVKEQDLKGWDYSYQFEKRELRFVVQHFGLRYRVLLGFSDEVIYYSKPSMNSRKVNDLKLFAALNIEEYGDLFEFVDCECNHFEMASLSFTLISVFNPESKLCQSWLIPERCDGSSDGIFYLLVEACE